jgi:hypothetical protein
VTIIEREELLNTLSAMSHFELGLVVGSLVAQVPGEVRKALQVLHPADAVSR